MKRSKLLLIYVSLLAATTTGCASRPSSIPAASVSDEGYKSMDCAALKAERDRLLSTLHAATDEQQSRAIRDVVAGTIGVAVSPLFFVLLSGETDVVVEISRLKGELDATTRMLNQKKCG